MAQFPSTESLEKIIQVVQGNVYATEYFVACVNTTIDAILQSPRQRNMGLGNVFSDAKKQFQQLLEVEKAYAGCEGEWGGVYVKASTGELLASIHAKEAISMLQTLPPEALSTIFRFVINDASQMFFDYSGASSEKEASLDRLLYDWMIKNRITQDAETGTLYRLDQHDRRDSIIPADEFRDLLISEKEGFPQYVRKEIPLMDVTIQEQPTSTGASAAVSSAAQTP